MAFLKPQQPEATSARCRTSLLAFSQDLVIIRAFSSSVIAKQATVTVVYREYVWIQADDIPSQSPSAPDMDNFSQGRASFIKSTHLDELQGIPERPG